MDDQQKIENVKDLNLLFETLGFDDATKNDHLSRIMTIILASVSEKLDKATEFKDKAELPMMKSFKDFYDYYEQYVDRATIDKIIEEESLNAFSGYFKTIADQLPK